MESLFILNTDIIFVQEIIPKHTLTTPIVMKKRHLFVSVSLLIAFPLLLMLTSFKAKKPENHFDLDKEAAPLSQGVWFSRFEITNLEYKDFLLYLVSTGQRDKVPDYAPDVNVWIRDFAFNDPYATYYFAHPAFDDYPVVGISYEAAVAFCEWKTIHHQEVLNVSQKGGEPGRKLITRYRFRLPTSEEWELAAQGDGTGPRVYAGGWYYPRDAKGRFVFNHKIGKGDYAGFAGPADGKHNGVNDFEGYMITAPVKSFYPDDLGLYNLAGNVAEMVAQEGIARGGSWAHLAGDCEIGSTLAYIEPECWLGFRWVVDVLEE